MNEKIKWGIIGSGGIAKRRTIHEGIVPSENAELVSVYDVIQNINSEVAAEFNAHMAISIDELLKQDIDAEYIASPVDKHFEHVSACAKAKKHILCEKALGLTISEVEIMISICQQAGVLLGTAFMMRFHTDHPNVQFNYFRGGIGICNAEMH
jgi:predicted dehydrogenase